LNETPRSQTVTKAFFRISTQFLGAFERLADTADVLLPPNDQQGELDSRWARLRLQEQHELRVAEAIKAFEALKQTACRFTRQRIA